MLNFKPNLPITEKLAIEDGEKKSFKEFLKSQQGATALQITALALKSNLTTTIAGISGAAAIFGGKETEQSFAQGVKEIVQSEGFTDELSQSIGIPLRDETEDQFVVRAKAKMTDLLRKKLSK
jgi:hypothetical protein